MALVALLALGTLSGVPARPAAAQDSNGTALFLLPRWLDLDVEYGENVYLTGGIQDASGSCTGPALDCDTPTGTVKVYGATTTYGTVPVTPNPVTPDSEYADWEITIPPGHFYPGTWEIAYLYSGNFDAHQSIVTVNISKQACRNFTLTQSSDGTSPGQPVRFTADLGLNGPRFRTGTLTIYQGDEVLATDTDMDDGRSLGITTSALPQGATDLHATYSGDGYYEGCTTPLITHRVSFDAYPTARDDSVSTAVGEPVMIPFLANDSDDGPTLDYDIQSTTDFGDLEGVDGGAVYTPDPDMGSYEDSFSYVVHDSVGQGSAVAQVHIDVGCTPVAKGENYTVGQGSVLGRTAPGVTANDQTCDGSPVSVRTQPAHGTLVLGTDGAFTYTPASGYSGDDSFTYQYADGLESPVDATVGIEVAPKAPPTTTTTTTTSTTTSSTTTAPPVPTAAVRQVTGWYEALLRRLPDGSGLGHWVAKLDAGAPPLAVTRQLVRSSEFNRRLVRDAYETCLGRQPDAGGLRYWATRLANGASADDLRVGLLASNEAWTAAGNDGSTWAGDLYQALLGRAPTAAERAAIAAQLRTGRTRAAAARSLAVSPSARRHLAATWYPAITGRPPTSSEARTWASAMANGATEQGLIAELASTLPVPN